MDDLNTYLLKVLYSEVSALQMFFIQILIVFVKYTFLCPPQKRCKMKGKKVTNLLFYWTCLSVSVKLRKKESNQFVYWLLESDKIPNIGEYFKSLSLFNFISLFTIFSSTNIGLNRGPNLDLSLGRIGELWMNTQILDEWWIWFALNTSKQILTFYALAWLTSLSCLICLGSRTLFHQYL